MISATVLTSGSDGTDITGLITTSSFTIPANKQVLIAVAGANTSGDAPDWTLTHSSGVADVIVGSTQTAVLGGANYVHMRVFRIQSMKEVTGSFLIDSISEGLGPTLVTAWVVVSLDNSDVVWTSETAGTSIIQTVTGTSNSATALAATLAAFGNTQNGAVAFWSTVRTGVTLISPEWTEITEINANNGSLHLTLEAMYITTNDTSVTATADNTCAYVGKAIEIRNKRERGILGRVNVGGR